MHSFSKKQKRFSLLVLEEGEIYTRDSFGYRTHPAMFPEKRQEKGRIHICSRSLIFEPEDIDTPIVRYAYRDMQNTPQEQPVSRSAYAYTENATRLVFEVTKLTELPDSKAPHPYKHVKLDPPHNVALDFTYESVATMTEWVKDLHQRNFGHAAGFDQDSEIAEFVMQRERGIRFDMSRIVNTSERPVTSVPMLVRRIRSFMTMPGLFYLTDQRLYFQSIYRTSANPVKHINLNQVQKLHKRRHKLRNLGFELYYAGRKSLFVAFYTERERDTVFGMLLSLVGPECETENSVENMTLKWQLRQISNYDYLMYLNSAAYRTFSDFTQYPVLPWVLADYSSDSLDLNNPANYRDLSKPVGALSEPRLTSFKKRFKDMPEPKFLYGTHYSAPGYIIGFLFRKYPLLMIRLHGGKYDSPDRLFSSIEAQWKSVNENPADVKELIPEFYSNDPAFLTNNLHLDFGVKQDGERVSDVSLPEWASSPKDFLDKMKAALESEHVSQHLHLWIDLIFGYKQRGEAAVQADNCTIDLDSISDPVHRKAMEMQINEFGQTPKQLFTIPHPPRGQEETKEPALRRPSLTWSTEQVTRKAPGNITEVSLHKKRISSIQLLDGRAVTTGHDGCLKIVALEKLQKRTFTVCNLALSCSALLNDKQVVTGSYDSKLYFFNFDNGRTSSQLRAHDDAITCCAYLGGLNAVCSGSWDSTVKLWDVRDSSPQHVFEDHDEQVHSMCVASTKDSASYKLVTGDLDGRIVVRDVRKGVLTTFEASGQVSALKLTAHGNHIVAGLPNGLEVYEESGNLVKSLDFGASCIDSDGVFVLGGQEGEPLELWELMNGVRLHAWPNIRGPTALAVANGGQMFAAGNCDGTLFCIR